MEKIPSCRHKIEYSLLVPLRSPYVTACIYNSETEMASFSSACNKPCLPRCPSETFTWHESRDYKWEAESYFRSARNSRKHNINVAVANNWTVVYYRELYVEYPYPPISPPFLLLIDRGPSPLPPLNFSARSVLSIDLDSMKIFPARSSWEKKKIRRFEEEEGAGFK